MNDKAKLIADKMAEPAVAKLKDAWTDPAAPRWLQVTKVKPTGVDHWVVRLRSGKEILLTDEEWNGAIYNADHAQGQALRLIGAEDERQTKLHELLETIREQIRIGVAPEHRPDGLFKNIQDAVYAMRGRTPLLNDAAIVGAFDAIHAERAPTEHWEWSEYYYRRARDGMMEYLRDNRAWSISKDQGAREFDEAFRHAVDILALSVRRQSPAVTESCTLCADDDSPGFYKGCMVRDKYGDAHLDWNCDGKGNLTRRSQPETSSKPEPRG